MIIEKKYEDSSSENAMENFSVQITDTMLYDRLHILSAEYSLNVDFLVNVAVKRLVDDIDFIRSLRSGK